MILLDGKVVRDTIVADLKQKYALLGFPVTLVIIQIGKRPDSTAYIEQKRKLADILEVKVIHKIFPESVLEKDIVECIEKYNMDKTVQGIIVQLPIPENINSQKIIETISYSKDVDALTSKRVSDLIGGVKTEIIPATARGVRSLLSYYGISVSGKKIAVIGRSNLVGKPIAEIFSCDGADVSVCHRQTKNVAEITRQADIIVSAAGVPRLITKDHVSPGQVIVDVGINLVSGGYLNEEVPLKKFVGDVDFEEVAPIVKAISPVPGGVGPMTVVSLFQNLFDVSKGV